ncbi:sulfotransferase [bacterium]|nr:sulfotransferase [bacterium]
MSLTLKERPVFIIGYERSGTTLLMAMLGCHPHIGIPEVGWLFPRIYPWRHTYGDLSVDANFRTMASEMVFGLNQPLWGMPVNPATIVDDIVASARERSFAGIYDAMHQRYLLETGVKKRWGQKTPNNLYFVPQILDCFPNAQFIFIVRDGRDAAATSMSSAFGAGNIWGAAYTWHKANDFVKKFRETCDDATWYDIRYEDLCLHPETVLKGVCDFIGETYEPAMLDFHQTPIGVARGKQRDHAPLGSPVSGKHIGMYKKFLSVHEQEVYATIAGATHTSYGYETDYQPIDLPDKELALMQEWDGRIRAARLDGTGGHIIFESYRDWLVDQRQVRKNKGIWSDADDPGEFPVGDIDEEIIVGYRAWKQWKDHFAIKRRYD